MDVPESSPYFCWGSVLMILSPGDAEANRLGAEVGPLGLLVLGTGSSNSDRVRGNQAFAGKTSVWSLLRPSLAAAATKITPAYVSTFNGFDERGSLRTGNRRAPAGRVGLSALLDGIVDRLDAAHEVTRAVFAKESCGPDFRLTSCAMPDVPLSTLPVEPMIPAQCVP
jgi:hypothetical protein